MSNEALHTELLTRLLHAHPNGLGNEILDNYRGEKAVAGMLKKLQDEGLIHAGSVSVDDHEVSLNYPIKLSHAGVEKAKSAEATQPTQH